MAKQSGRNRTLIFALGLAFFLIVIILGFYFIKISKQWPMTNTVNNVSSNFVSVSCENNIKTYRSLTEAMKNPDIVCNLDLSDQNLPELPQNVLKLKNLRSLWLNFNKISTLPAEISSLKNLWLLDLTGNPISNEEIEKLKVLLPNVHITRLVPMDLPTN